MSSSSYESKNKTEEAAFVGLYFLVLDDIFIGTRLENLDCQWNEHYFVEISSLIYHQNLLLESTAENL